MRKVLALLLCCALLSGCVLRAAAETEESVAVYRLCADASAPGGLTAERVTLLAGETELDAILRGLNAGSEDAALTGAFPEGISVLSCDIGGGRARVVMSEGYAALDGLEKTLTDYAVTCSLAMLDSVVTVDLYEGERPVSLGLSAADAELSNTGYESVGRIVKLFVPDTEALCLRPRTVLVTSDGERDVWTLTVLALLSALDGLPESTALRSVKCADGLCTVNLSEELYTTEPEYAYNARLILTAFVNTLCCLPQVERVELLVGGVPMVSYGSYIPAWPMSYDEGLVRYE